MDSNKVKKEKITSLCDVNKFYCIWSYDDNELATKFIQTLPSMYDKEKKKLYGYISSCKTTNISVQFLFLFIIH